MKKKQKRQYANTVGTKNDTRRLEKRPNTNNSPIDGKAAAQKR